MVRAVTGEGRTVPRFDFGDEAMACPLCGGGLRIIKTRHRRVISLAHGPFEARELIKQCRNRCCPPLRSATLAQLIKPGRKYAYDLVVYVGLARYIAGLQREEIERLLRDEHGIEVSDGSVTELSDLFLGYLEALHIARAPALREALGDDYPMHLDATCERGKGGLFVCISGWKDRQWVLWAARVHSESGANLTPVVDKAVSLFGKPICTMRDLGEGCANAVAPLQQAGVLDLVCHYHFLAAVGRSLFKRLYDKLQELLRNNGIRTEMRALLRDMRKYSSVDRTQERFGRGTIREELKALVLWILEGDGHSEPPFPFSLHHLDFAQRCQQAQQKADSWVPRSRTAPERRALACLDRLVEQLDTVQHFKSTLKELETRRAAFCELRQVLRLSNAELPRGDRRTAQEHLTGLELSRLEQIKQAVDHYTKTIEGRITAREKRAKKQNSSYSIILRYLRQYGPHLFGHPSKRDENGNVVDVANRTNNIAEHFFGNQKQQLRRRVGRGQLGRDLEKQPAQVALVTNLQDPEYVRQLAGSLDQLPAAFAAIDDGGISTLPALLRDNRDTQLRSVLRNLLEQTAAEAPAASNPEKTYHHELSEPTEEEIAASADEIRQMSKDELQARTIPTIASELSPKTRKPLQPRDPRLPPPGTVIERWYGGKIHRVELLEQGFRYRGRVYPTLHKVALAFTKKPQNSFSFFGLTQPWSEAFKHLRGRRLNKHNMLNFSSATEF